MVRQMLWSNVCRELQVQWQWRIHEVQPHGTPLAASELIVETRVLLENVEMDSLTVPEQSHHDGWLAAFHTDLNFFHEPLTLEVLSIFSHFFRRSREEPILIGNANRDDHTEKQNDSRKNVEQCLHVPSSCFQRFEVTTMLQETS